MLPPIAKLTREQAMYYFLSGYTAKVAGTERGVKEPQATFSSCFGAVFLVWHPTKYAEMLGKLIDEHESDVWLVNTGWTGGAFGVGKRMKLRTRARWCTRCCAATSHSTPLDTDPIFGLQVPTHIADVPDDVLNPRNTWPDKTAYDEQAKKLAGMFRENFAKFEKYVSDAVKAAGPRDSRHGTRTDSTDTQRTPQGHCRYPQRTAGAELFSPRRDCRVLLAVARVRSDGLVSGV